MTTNASNNSRLRLVVSGQVKPYITVEPRRVVLRGRAGEKISETVRIIPQTDDPFHIRAVSAIRGVDVRYTLEELEESGKKGYALHLENRRKIPGRYHDSIKLETDSDVAETITIAVGGVILAPEQQKQ
ncbi:MAG: hypothetical protein K9K62_02105 [Desulfobacteraceae bacterium]|nr:hypothetical protein [Desulfobacteraceae bacterium]